MRKPFRSRLLAACAATLAVVLALPALAPAAGIFGFNEDFTPGNLKRLVGLARQFHANSARIVVYWGAVEPRRHRDDWYWLDRLYAGMVARHTRPLFTVTSAPHWAAAHGCWSYDKCQVAPAHDGDFRRFLTQMTKRYPRAIGFEIGQEPNLHNWSVHPDPVRYTQVLKSAWRAIKRANPHMAVITGSTCCNTTHGLGNIGASTFLARMYRAGARGYFDAIGFHVYPGRAVSLVAPDIHSELGGMGAVRAAYRDSKPFWITEIGFLSGGVSPYGGGVYTEANQALRESIAYRTLNSMPDVRAIYLFRLVDPRSRRLAPMGIFRSNLRPKASARALRALTRTRR